MTLIPSKHVRQEIQAEGSRLFRYAQSLLRLVQAERENTDEIKSLKARLTEVEQEVRDLRSREAGLIASADAAASRAAAQIVADLALRIGRIEGERAARGMVDRRFAADVPPAG